MDFEYKSIIAQKNMSLEELNKYYRDKREYNFYNNLGLIKKSDILLNEKINKALVPILRDERIKAGRNLTILDDRRIKRKIKKPYIYAVTHIGRYDIETAIEVINDGNYFLLGDPGELYRNSEGQLLKFKGIIPFDTDEKYEVDRRIAYENCVRVLNLGGNVFLFPEAAWNITPNQTVMRLFNGAVKMAKEAGAEIIPIAIEQYGKDYYVIIGKNIVLLKDDPRTNDELSAVLRGFMAGLKFEIRNEVAKTTRKELLKPYDYDYEKAKEDYLANIMSESENGYTIEEIERTRYRDKNTVTPKEAFDFKIIPNEKNKILFLSDEEFKKYNRQLIAKKMIEEMEQQELESMDYEEELRKII